MRKNNQHFVRRFLRVQNIKNDIWIQCFIAPEQFYKFRIKMELGDYNNIKCILNISVFELSLGFSALTRLYLLKDF